MLSWRAFEIEFGRGRRSSFRLTFDLRSIWIGVDWFASYAGSEVTVCLLPCVSFSFVRRNELPPISAVPSPPEGG